MPVFIYAALLGPGAVETAIPCLWQALPHFLSLSNASLSFFVYLALSQRFRDLLLE